MRSTARGTLVSLLLACAALALFAAPAAAKPAEIAYRCDVDICLIDPDNPAAIVNLTNNGSKTFDEEPVWSPSGDRVAFVSHETGLPERLRDGPRRAGPDGQRRDAADPLRGKQLDLRADLVARTARGSPTSANRAASAQIFLVAADGSTLTPLSIAAPGEHPSFSPDGGKIAFSKGGEQVWTDERRRQQRDRAGDQRARARPDLVARRDLHRLRRQKRPVRRLVRRQRRQPRRRRARRAPGQLRPVDLRHLVAGRGQACLPLDRAGCGDDAGRRVHPGRQPRRQRQRRAAAEVAGSAPTSTARPGRPTAPASPSRDSASRRCRGSSRSTSRAPTAPARCRRSPAAAATRTRLAPDPLRTPVRARVTPSEGSAGQPPGGRKPKLVWFTKRIPITGGGPIHMMIVVLRRARLRRLDPGHVAEVRGPGRAQVPPGDGLESQTEAAADRRRQRRAEAARRRGKAAAPLPEQGRQGAAEGEGQARLPGHGHGHLERPGAGDLEEDDPRRPQETEEKS